MTHSIGKGQCKHGLWCRECSGAVWVPGGQKISRSNEPEVRVVQGVVCSEALSAYDAKMRLCNNVILFSVACVDH